MLTIQCSQVDYMVKQGAVNKINTYVVLFFLFLYKVRTSFRVHELNVHTVSSQQRKNTQYQDSAISMNNLQKEK